MICLKDEYLLLTTPTVRSRVAALLLSAIAEQVAILLTMAVSVLTRDQIHCIVQQKKAANNNKNNVFVVFEPVFVGDRSIVKSLIATYGVDCTDFMGRTPLTYAVMGRRKLIFSHNAMSLFR